MVNHFQYLRIRRPLDTPETTIRESGARLLRVPRGRSSAAACQRPRLARPWHARQPGPYATGRKSGGEGNLGGSRSRAPVPPRWHASADARGARLRRLGVVPRSARSAELGIPAFGCSSGPRRHGIGNFSAAVVLTRPSDGGNTATMDWRTFVVEITKAAAWPSLVLLLAMLPGPVKRLLDRITKLEAGTKGTSIEASPSTMGRPPTELTRFDQSLQSNGHSASSADSATGK